MLFPVLAPAAVCNHSKTKAEAVTLTRRGLYPRIGRNSGEDDRIDATGLELLLKVGSGECAPVTLCKQDVAGLKSRRRGNLRSGGGQRCIPQIDCLVSRKLEEIVEVDADLNHPERRRGEMLRPALPNCQRPVRPGEAPYSGRRWHSGGP
jgi:hypothetical protein